MELIEEDQLNDSDDDDDPPSSCDSNYDEGQNLLSEALENEVTAQLVAAGVVIIGLKLCNYLCYLWNDLSGWCSCSRCHYIIQETEKATFIWDKSFNQKKTAKSVTKKVKGMLPVKNLKYIIDA